MNREEKETKLKELISEGLKLSIDAMMNNIDVVIKSGAIDVEKWDFIVNPMILPKSIICALLSHEIDHYNGKGTSYEKEIKKVSKNIRYFI